MSESIRILKAEKEHFGEIYGLIKTFSEFIKTPEKVKITPEQMRNDSGYFNAFIAVYENRIIGFASYFFAYYSWTGKAVYLDDLFVLEAYRGMGAGNALFEKVRSTAVSENCSKLKWQVSSWNSSAINYYKSKGATIDEVEINCEILFANQLHAGN